jgi:hypothetical protein
MCVVSGREAERVRGGERGREERREGVCVDAFCLYWDSSTTTATTATGPVFKPPMGVRSMTGNPNTLGPPARQPMPAETTLPTHHPPT